MTQQQLGQMVGISQSMIAAIENELAEPSLSTLTRIAHALNISARELATALIDDKQEALQ